MNQTFEIVKLETLKVHSGQGDLQSATELLDLRHAFYEIGLARTKPQSETVGWGRRESRLTCGPVCVQHAETDSQSEGGNAALWILSRRQTEDRVILSGSQVFEPFELRLYKGYLKQVQ